MYDCTFRFVKDGSPVTEFLDMVAVEKADADGVLAALWEAFEKNGISREVVKERIIGCTFDGASVNQGAKGGVVTKLREMIPHVLVSIWCVPHKLELAVLDARKSKGVVANLIQTVEKAVESVFKFYHGSAKRRRDVNSIAEVLEEDSVYFSAPQGTRWMASRKRAYRAVATHLNSVIMHLEEVSNKTSDEGSKCTGYLKTLKSRYFMDGLHFLIDFLDILTDVSLEFQKDALLITDVQAKLVELTIRLEELKSTNGPMFAKYLENLNDNKFENKGKMITLTGQGLSKTTMLAFLQDSIEFTSKRFHFLNETPFKDFAVFDIRNLPNQSADLVGYGNESIDNLVEHFSSVMSDEEKENCRKQWPALKSKLKLQKLLKSKSPSEAVGDIITENSEDVKAVVVLMLIMSTLSPSSAAVERGFSKMNNIKTVRKVRMNNATLSALMRVNCLPQNVKDFDPIPTVAQWMSVSNRHISK